MASLEDDWYYRKGNEVIGPVSREELHRLAQEGVLQPDDFVRCGTRLPWSNPSRGLFPQDAPATANDDIVIVPSEGSANLAQKVYHGTRKLIIIAVLFGVLNIVLIGSQMVWHGHLQQKLDRTEQELEIEYREILENGDELNRLLQGINDSESRIASLESRIEALEDRYTSGMPPGAYDRYSNLVDERNALALTYNNSLARYNNLSTEYSTRIDNYNSRVEEAIILEKRIATTWYLVPIPRLAGGR